MHLHEFIVRSLEEDVGPGDYSSLSCVDHEKQGKAHLIVKEDGVLVGVEITSGLVFSKKWRRVFSSIKKLMMAHQLKG